MAAGLIHRPVQSWQNTGNTFSVVALGKANSHLIPVGGLRPGISLHRRQNSCQLVTLRSLSPTLANPSKHNSLPKVSEGDCEQKQESDEDAFHQAIFELEFNMREAAEVLEGMQERLSTSDLQLVLKYFAQEGKDSWYALEVFEWMQKMNRVEDDTHKLMLSIMSNWITKLVEEENPIESVKCLLEDMNCVGLKPDFRMLHYIISVYWDKGRKPEVLAFVKDILDSGMDKDAAMDPVSFLLLKMSANGEQKEALHFLKQLHASSNASLKPSAYTAGLMASIVEQEQLTVTRRQLHLYYQSGKISKFDEEDLAKFNAYEASLHSDAEDIASWALESEAALGPVVYERLVAIYCIAGKGLDAERSMWNMKLAGREPPIQVYNTIIGICGYSNHNEAAMRILEGMKLSNLSPSSKTYSCLIGGFLKGGHYTQAADAMLLMLDRGLIPDDKVIVAVLYGVQKVQKADTYLRLCKRLVHEGLIENCLFYLYMDAYNLCIIRML